MGIFKLALIVCTTSHGRVGGGGARLQGRVGTYLMYSNVNTWAGMDIESDKPDDVVVVGTTCAKL